MMPSQFKCQSVEDFIGPAQSKAKFIDKLIKKAVENGSAPVKLLILGQPGIGKSELSNFAARIVGASKWSTYRWNGTRFKVEDADTLAATLAMTNLFGQYRVIQIEEVDKVPTVAQVRLLTLLDDMPPANLFIGTSNCKISELEDRFQRRFTVIDLKAPESEEIERLLSKFELPPAEARQIATFACGNVGQALMDADAAVVAAS